MKNLKLTLAVILFAATTNLHSQTATPPSSGDGSPGNPYLISSLDNLYWITQNSSEWDMCYLQTNNINAASTSTWAAGAGFSPIGNAGTKFTGVYDGGNHTISNLFIDRSSTDYCGMFGWAAAPAEIKGVGLVNVDITGDVRVGGLLGYSTSGTGSLAITSCYSTGNVKGTSIAGGLIGESKFGIIRKSMSESNVTTDVILSVAGGFVGENDASIFDCYARGDVSSSFLQIFLAAGGFCGANDNSGSITNCYATGVIAQLGVFGGFCGTNAIGGTATNCFWDRETSLLNISALGLGQLTATLKVTVTFTTAGWDFVGEVINGTNDIWLIDGTTNDGYPFFGSFTTLPVGWIDFTAQKQNGSVLLKWITASEQNTKDFIVQHSSNGITWNNIGTLTASGNSAVTSNYSFTHNNPVSDKNHYRIQQRDLDGKSSFSKVISVNFANSTNLTILGNPVINGILKFKVSNPVVVSLHNEKGQTLLSQQFNNGIHSINLSQYSKGVYWLKAGDDSQLVVIQ